MSKHDDRTISALSGVNAETFRFRGLATTSRGWMVMVPLGGDTPRVDSVELPCCCACFRGIWLLLIRLAKRSYLKNRLSIVSRLKGVFGNRRILKVIHITTLNKR